MGSGKIIAEAAEDECIIHTSIGEEHMVYVVCVYSSTLRPDNIPRS